MWQFPVIAGLIRFAPHLLQTLHITESSPSFMVDVLQGVVTLSSTLRLIETPNLIQRFRTLIRQSKGLYTIALFSSL